MKRITLAILFLSIVASAQTANTPYVTITGTNANYAGGTIYSSLIRPGKANAVSAKVVLTGTGQFSLMSWNNLNSHNAPSTTVFTITTADGKTSWSTQAMTIAESQDISQVLTLAPIPQQ